MLTDHRSRWVYLSIVGLVMASLSCGGSSPTATPTPVPRVTLAPTPTPRLTAEASPSDTPPPPNPEGTSDAPAVVEITDLILGVSARGYDHYAMGSTAARGSSEPYFFIDPNACGMKLEVRTMPTSALPGATALEALPVVYQQNYVAQSSASVDWTITQEPFELELNGEPAARLEAERVQNDRMALFQITVVRSQTRSAIVHGQIGESCAERPASMAYLNEMTDSVMLHDPAPVCYVGLKPGSDPAEYRVGCDSKATGHTAQGTLADRGFTQIEMGPVTWDECAEFMRAHDQEYW